MNRPSARTNFPNRARRRSRSRSPTATSPEARTCPIRVPCHHAAIHSSAEQDYPAPFNRTRVHWISAKAKARVAAFVHLCSPTATRFSPPPSFSCSSSFSFSIPHCHPPRNADLSNPRPLPSRPPSSGAKQDYRVSFQSCSLSRSCSLSIPRMSANAPVIALVHVRSPRATRF